jgi:SAM-dependent methyltransferase
MTGPEHAPVTLVDVGMRGTWDALAGADSHIYVGDPARGGGELESLFGRLGADPRGGVCVEVGCGPGRMTGDLAARFDRVLALDVSPAMIERARDAVPAENVDFRVVSGERLDGVPDAAADVLVCYLVLQHLPRRSFVEGYLQEFARVLAPGGQAFVQLPLLEPGSRPRAWRAVRTITVPLLHRLAPSPDRAPALRGVRLTEAELAAALDRAGLEIRARDEGPDAPYRYSRDVFLRLSRR